MIEKPNLQESLYGFDTIFNEIALLYKNNKLPNKILLSGPKGSGKSTLAYHIINYILSSKEDFSYNSKDKLINKKNKSFILLNNKTHPNFFLVDLKNDKKYIEISQTREMINYVNKSNFNQLPKFILIDNVEYLNKNSLNSLLKIILPVVFVAAIDSVASAEFTITLTCKLKFFGPPLIIGVVTSFPFIVFPFTVNTELLFVTNSTLSTLMLLGTLICLTSVLASKITGEAFSTAFPDSFIKVLGLISIIFSPLIDGLNDIKRINKLNKIGLSFFIKLIHFFSNIFL
mgnify:CR=1 FL=1